MDNQITVGPSYYEVPTWRSGEKSY